MAQTILSYQEAVRQPSAINFHFKSQIVQARRASQSIAKQLNPHALAFKIKVVRKNWYTYVLYTVAIQQR